MPIDSKIIALIIQEEEKKRLERSREYGERAVIYDMPMDEPVEEKKEESQRGVIVIDI